MLSDARKLLTGIDRQVLDAIVAAAALVAIELTCWLTPGTFTHDRVITAIAAIPFVAPIAVRRRWPAAALVVSAAAVTVSMPLGGQLLSNDNAYVIPVLVLAYSAGAWAGARRAAVALCAALALLYAWALLPGPDGSSTGTGQAAWALFYVTVLLVPVWLVGWFVGRHGERTRAFHELAEDAAAERDLRDATAVADERARIGAELHDIVAHAISAMVVQAASARLLLNAEPDQSRAAILNVERTGRQALSDLRRLLGMLRKDDDPRALSPQPGLGQLPALIDAAQRAGLECERRTLGQPIDLTPGIDLVAYRVIETALQAAAERNAVRSVVTIHYQPRNLELVVTGETPIPELDRRVAGLAQRIALYRGKLLTERDAQGFALTARLPLDAGAPV